MPLECAGVRNPESRGEDARGPLEHLEHRSTKRVQMDWYLTMVNVNAFLEVNPGYARVPLEHPRTS